MAGKRPDPMVLLAFLPRSPHSSANGRIPIQAIIASIEADEAPATVGD